MANIKEKIQQLNVDQFDTQNKKTLKLSPIHILASLTIISLLINSYFLLQKCKEKDLQNSSNLEYGLLASNIDNIAKPDRIVHSAPLKAELTEYINKRKDIKTSVYFEYLRTGSNFSINVDLYTYPASLTKVPIAIMIMSKVEKGDLNLDQTYKIDPKFKDQYSGDLYKVADYTQVTLRELIEQSLVYSDNTAKNILNSLVTDDDIKDLVNNLGMDNLFNKQGNTTAKEYARIFRSLYYASMLSQQDSEYILDLLTKSARDKFMAVDIPENIPVAHKYGSMKPERSFSDVGIVYIHNRPFLIAVTIDGRDSTDFDETRAQEVIGTIVSKAYKYISTR